MNDHLKQFANHAAYQAAESSLDRPNVSYCVNENEVHYNPIVSHDYSQDYLTFVAKESGTFTFTPSNSNIISYSTDGGETWTQGNSIEVNNGDKVLWKGTMTPSTSYPLSTGTFSSTAEFDVQGNAMSLLFGDNFKEQTSLTGKDYAFCRLFYQNTKVINAENLLLPATTLTEGCYETMFYGCTGLITTPELPATTLANYCYNSMFNGCTSLTTTPELPATTLASNCYNGIFNGCTGLVTAPELPATTLANYCYNFMFDGCTSLNYIKAMFTTTPGNSYTWNWVRGVSATGTFVKNSAASWTTTGDSGVPSGWTVQTASK